MVKAVALSIDQGLQGENLQYCHQPSVEKYLYPLKSKLILLNINKLINFLTLLK